MGMVGMGIDVAGIPQGWKWELQGSLGTEFVLREPRGDALEILQTLTIILVQALEY